MSAEPSGVAIWASQLAANDFPPVCAMTGRPAETWREFHLGGFAGHLPLTRGSSRRLTLALWIPIVLIAVAIALWISAVVVGARSAGSTNPIKQSVVYGTWVADPGASAGPHPGYRPALTDVSGGHITYVGVTKDSNGTDWDVELQFDSTGAAALSDVSRKAIAACPGDINTDTSANCSERFVAIWLGLTAADISRWDDSFYATDISRPTDSACIEYETQNLCGKLVTDTIIEQPLDGGDVVITIGTQQDAQALADIIQAPPNPGSPLGRAVAWSLAGLGVLLAVAGALGLALIRRTLGPRGTLMLQQPVYYDTLIELFNVHPLFAGAVAARQRERSTPAAEVPPPPTAPPQPLPT